LLFIGQFKVDSYNVVYFKKLKKLILRYCTINDMDRYTMMSNEEMAKVYKWKNLNGYLSTAGYYASLYRGQTWRIRIKSLIGSAVSQIMLQYLYIIKNCSLNLFILVSSPFDRQVSFLDPLDALSSGYLS
jgi:hypothetical protein